MVLHCAALVHQMKGAPTENYFKINFELTKALAEKSKTQKVKHFVFISTAHVYGEYGDLVNHTRLLTESAPCHPLDPYGQSKLAAEQFLQTLRDSEFRVSVIRPPMVYGEGAKGNLLALNKLIGKVHLLPFKYNENKRSVIYVGNLAYFIHLVIQHEQSGTYLPQDRKSISLQELAELLARVSNKNIYLFRLPHFVFRFLCFLKPHIMTRLFGTLALDVTESNRQLGYEPPFETEQGLRAMFSHLQEKTK